MRRAVAFILKVLLGLILILLAVSLAAGPICRGYINRNAERLIGREAYVGRISLNLLTGGIGIHDLNVMEADTAGRFIHIGRIDTRVSPVQLPLRSVSVGKLVIDTLDIQVSQNGKSFSFDDIVAHLSKGDGKKADRGGKSRWTVRLRNSALMNSSILYRDLQIGSRLLLENINIGVPDIVLGGKERSDLNLSLKFSDGGSLSSKVTSRTDGGLFSLLLDIEDFPVSYLLPYIQKSLDIRDLEGTFSTQLNVDGDTSHISQLGVSGTASLRDIAVISASHEDIASISDIGLGIRSIDLEHRAVVLDSVRIHGLEAAYEIFRDSTSNISRLKVSRHEKAEKSAKTGSEGADRPKLSLTAASVSMSNSRVEFTDRRMAHPFRYTVSDISVRSDGFSLRGQNSARISARMQNTGTVSVSWRGKLGSIADQDISVRLENLALEPFSPYCMHMFGYPVKEGSLVFDSQNVISGYELTGSNSLDIYRLTLGKKEKGVKSEFNIPLRAGLYVIKDRNEHIKFDLPVSGTVNSPEFSYKKLIIRTLGNFLLKVAASPMTFVANALGSEDDGTSMEISALQDGFTTEQYGRLDRIADMMREKPELRLTLSQKIDYRKALDSYAMQKLTRAFVLRNAGSEASEDDRLIAQKADAVSTDSPELAAFADSLLSAAGAGQAEMSLQEKARKIYSANLDEGLARIISTRSGGAMEHLLKNGVDRNAVTVQDMSKDSMMVFTGHDVMEFRMTLDQNETELIQE